MGAFVLAQGIWKKSPTTIMAAYSVFVLCALGSGIAYLTGEAAEETVENIQGIAESKLEQHEEFAVVALIAFIVLGVVSLIGLFIEYRKFHLSRQFAFAVLLISLISFGLIGWEGYLGGQIRHTEINAYTTSIPSSDNGDESD
jgi:uncharacterized membrane protein